MERVQDAQEERAGAGDARRDVAEDEDLGAAGALRPVLELDRDAAGLQRGAHRAAHVDVGVALAALQLVALGRETALELGDHAVHRREVLDRAGRERAVELGQRPLRRQARRALDQVALELAPQVLLEAPQLLAREPFAARVVVGQVGLRLGAQPERAADPLDVDAEHARALAAPERGDREPREVAHRGIRAVPQRRGDLLAQRVEVDLGRPRIAASAPSLISRRAASASAARKKKRSNTSSNTRRSSGDLAIVAASASLKSS